MILLTGRIVPPRPQPMGKVIVRARIENVLDLYNVAQGALTADQARAVDLHDEIVQLQQITRELGWKPAYTFQKGIRETVEWYLQNQDWVQTVLHDPKK